MPKILALDLSRHVGFSIDHPDIPGVPLCGTWDLPGEQEEIGVAGYWLQRKLEAAVNLYEPGIIIYERPLDPRNLGAPQEELQSGHGKRKRFFSSYETIRLLLGLPMVVEVVARENKLLVYEAHVQSWRSHFCGTVKGGKEPTKARCIQLRWPFKNDNESDSMGLWCFAKSTLDPAFRPMQGRDN